MKIPKTPPSFQEVFKEINPNLVAKIMKLASNPLVSRRYLYWEKLQHYKVEGYTPQELWSAVKLHRFGNMKSIPLKDKSGKPFQFGVPELVAQQLHKIDMGAGATIGIPEPITNPQTKDKYLIRSLMEEAITSSQLEGAATTREAAKEMIRSGRPPRDTDEQMIFNNYITMQRITKLKDKALTPEMVFDIHRLVTEKTLPDPTAAGRFRKPDEKRVVGSGFGDDTVFHDPPPSHELEGRLIAMCEFANEKTPEFFIHPVVRAIILHFWLAFDHPFWDGNGRTARALFYWSMLHSGYWLFEFISISTILRKAPVKYGRSFLHTETDDNDLTYFIVAQIRVIQQAVDELHAYIDRKSLEMRELESQIRALDLFNHRQVDLIRHALKHPYSHYSIESHKNGHNIVYQTARTDLLDLESRGIVEKTMIGKKMTFAAPADLPARLRKMGKKLFGNK
jgi:Fic family protein